MIKDNLKNIFIGGLSGFLLALSLPNFFIPFSFLVGFSLLFYLIERHSTKDILIYSFVAGIVFSIFSFYWIVFALSYYGGINLIVSSVLFLIFSFAYSLYTFVLFSFIGKKVYQKYSFYGFFLLPFIWVFLEFFREFFPFNGFSWNLFGYMLSYINPVAQITYYTSVYGLSFLVLFFSVSFYLMVFKRDYRFVVLNVLNIIIFTLLLIWGNHRINSYTDTGKYYKVAVLQGNVDESMKLKPTKEINIKIIDKYIQLLKQAKEKGADIAVLPESALPFFPYIDSSLKDYFFQRFSDIKIPILSGFDNVLLKEDGDIDRVYNSLFLIDKDGFYVDYYSKIKLVPFGEYTPFRNSFLESIFTYLQGIDFSKGEGQKLLIYKDMKIASLICFESIFPDFVSNFVNKGVNVIVNITNDGWFGKTSAPYQHFEMARIRAIENNVYLIRAANTGISAVINPVGSVKSFIPLYKEGVLVEKVYLSSGKSFYNSYKMYIYVGFVFIFVFSLFLVYRLNPK
ncbi:apolipoprotein N-acyltransferase [Sulfurihydrogenibium azorense Az-Fu1]|uniref:Apolipoprotein N-acyltransferase n=1 Tax=Sulfurihydrogenibium azorense (strain DSM 15241 / OCM 825 / Az-Fu1) TaxID=204536 RepID=C1DW60_SULAA|nr:apolipoprotein N-acyltransferase [Sulfurihydrogenibium azorense]ACN99421.1 apolipoprotein N-acyltransferase [Sulfurihydrogenibium azorense Az-Fu1]